VQALLFQVVAELLDPRFVLDRPERVRHAAQPLGGILTVAAVDPVEVLGLGVVRLEVGIADGPRGGQAAVVANLAEVLRPQAEQRGPVELGVSPDVVQLSAATPTTGQVSSPRFSSPVERAEGHHPGQVTGDAEDDEHVRRARLVTAGCRGHATTLRAAGVPRLARGR
jgi:hypothetical protein